MKKSLMIVLAAACAATWAQEAKKDAKAAADPAKAAAQAEKRAMRMVKSAVDLMAEKEEDRAVGMLEAVSRMYPDSQAKYSAALELGCHFTGKRDFERALIELKKAYSATNDETRAESLLLQGELYIAKSQPGEAAMVFRRITPRPLNGIARRQNKTMPKRKTAWAGAIVKAMVCRRITPRR